MKRYLLVGAAALALISGWAWAQQLGSTILTGNEVIIASSGGPQGTSFFIPVLQLRNTTGYFLQATGTTVNTTVPNNAAKVLATGAITTWNVTLPTAPYDGASVAIACPGGTATVAVTATAPSGVSIVGTAFTACTSGGAAANTAEYIYSQTANVWYRIQ